MLSDLATDHVRSCLRWFAIVLACPLLLGLSNAWSFLLTFFLLILGVPAFLILLVAGAAVLSWHGVRDGMRHAGGRRWATLLAAPVSTLAAIGLCGPLMAVGRDVGWFVKLTVNHARYEATIAKVRRVGIGAAAEHRRAYLIDPGPPLRVAFDPQGLLDNWTGIVFDPSGDVMLARGFDPVTGKFVAPNRITKLFGGDLVACRPLFGSYYRCSFT